jgi:hypothetical protein
MPGWSRTTTVQTCAREGHCARHSAQKLAPPHPTNSSEVVEHFSNSSSHPALPKVHLLCLTAPPSRIPRRTPFPNRQSPRTPAGMPSGRRWSSGSRSASRRGHGPATRVPKLLPERPIHERCVEAYSYSGPGSRASLSGSRAGRRLTEDGNVEISGRDLREGSSAAIGSRPPNGSIRPKAVLPRGTRAALHIGSF